MIKVQLRTMSKEIYFDTADMDFIDYVKHIMKEKDALLYVEDFANQETMLRVSRIEAFTLMEESE